VGLVGVQILLDMWDFCVSAAQIGLLSLHVREGRAAGGQLGLLSCATAVVVPGAVGVILVLCVVPFPARGVVHACRVCCGVATSG
jgi:hypothetical protein